jgi:hypothetical protein
MKPQMKITLAKRFAAAVEAFKAGSQPQPDNVVGVVVARREGPPRIATVANPIAPAFVPRKLSAEEQAAAIKALSESGRRFAEVES